MYVVPILSTTNNDHIFSLEKNIATDFCEEYQVFSSCANRHVKYQQFVGNFHKVLLKSVSWKIGEGQLEEKRSSLQKARH